MRVLSFRKYALFLSAVLLIALSVVLLNACDMWNFANTEITIEGEDPGFVIPETGSLRVETNQDGSVFYVYVDKSNSVIDLEKATNARESFTVTDSAGNLVADNVLTVQNDGDSFTVYYGPHKTPYRIVVYFNNYCTVTFETVSQVFRVLKGECVSALDMIPLKTGYTFEGWDFNFSKPITDDTKISAIWKANIYTVNFDPQGGILYTESARVTFGEFVNFPVPNRN